MIGQYTCLIVSAPPFNSPFSLIGLVDILIELISFLSHVLFLQLLKEVTSTPNRGAFVHRLCQSSTEYKLE